MRNPVFLLRINSARNLSVRSGQAPGEIFILALRFLTSFGMTGSEGFGMTGSEGFGMTKVSFMTVYYIKVYKHLPNKKSGQQLFVNHTFPEYFYFILCYVYNG